MKVIAWLAGLGTLLAGAFYLVVSLNRWEWNRALFFGLIVLIAEVGLATGLVLRRLARLEHSLRGPADPAVVQILNETRPTRDRFAWMRESTGQLNVFITFVVAVGIRQYEEYEERESLHGYRNSTARRDRWHTRPAGAGPVTRAPCESRSSPSCSPAAQVSRTTVTAAS